MFARHFELHSAAGPVGELRFKGASTAYGALTSAGSTTKSWTIKGTGIFSRRVTLRESGTEDDRAIFRPNIRGRGWVEFSTGSRFFWKSTDSWPREWGFSNVREEPLFLLKPNRWFSLKIQSVVQIGAQWSDLDELPPLLMLGWYLRVQDFYAGW